MASFLPVVLQNLNSLIQKEVGLLWGVDKEMKKLASTLTTIQAVLQDAEQKQFQDKAIQNWLRKLNDAAYEVRDILEDCETEAPRKRQSSSSLKKVGMVRDWLHELVKEEIKKKDSSTEEWKIVMERSFNRMDNEVIAWNDSVLRADCRCELQTPECNTVGSTAVVAVVTPDPPLEHYPGDEINEIERIESSMIQRFRCR